MDRSRNDLPSDRRTMVASCSRVHPRRSQQQTASFRHTSSMASARFRQRDGTTGIAAAVSAARRGKKSALRPPRALFQAELAQKWPPELSNSKLTQADFELLSRFSPKNLPSCGLSHESRGQVRFLYCANCRLEIARAITFSWICTRSLSARVMPKIV